MPTKTVTKDQLASVQLDSLDNLWFQVGGTICNLACDHCFISCSPENDKFKMMSMAEIQPYLNEAIVAGVKEFYFTGGEPFLNPEIFDILGETLKIGPATVLTNGTLISPRRARILAELFNNTIYSLEIRVSLDGFDEKSNDTLRGAGSFERAVRGIGNLAEVGLLPIITAVQTWPDDRHEKILAGFTALLKSAGYTQPRLKILPVLDIGAYRENKIGPGEERLVTEEHVDGFDMSLFLCNNSRMVTDTGVYVCPILIDYPEARMADTLSHATGSYRLKHSACYTCYLSGAICSNFSSGGQTER